MAAHHENGERQRENDANERVWFVLHGCSAVMAIKKGAGSRFAETKSIEAMVWSGSGLFHCVLKTCSWVWLLLTGERPDHATIEFESCGVDWLTQSTTWSPYLTVKLWVFPLA